MIFGVTVRRFFLLSQDISEYTHANFSIVSECIKMLVSFANKYHDNVS